ncbi:hypothetical protein GCM10011609_71410 [Lentzea pudingi]|uniref:Uncharacterized protein n=1 Tax=Lentzea pudingi TaxID=1789439 RepID=A0ABQ2IQL8_9PSEU|nr:hypothetical protein GCM10011609_71410 [Lentzea pudingi]
MQIFFEFGVSAVRANKPVLAQVIAELRRGTYAGLLVPAMSHIAATDRQMQQIAAQLEECHAWIEECSKN